MSHKAMNSKKKTFLLTLEFQPLSCLAWSLAAIFQHPQCSLACTHSLCTPLPHYYFLLFTQTSNDHSPLCLQQYKLNEAFKGLPFDSQLPFQPFSPMCLLCTPLYSRCSLLDSSLSVTRTFPLRACSLCHNPPRKFYLPFGTSLKCSYNCLIFCPKQMHLLSLWAHKIMYTSFMVFRVICFALAVSVQESSTVLSFRGILRLCQNSCILWIEHNSIDDQAETHSGDFRLLLCSSQNALLPYLEEYSNRLQ